MKAFDPARFELGKPLLLGGLRRRHDFAAAETGIAEQWREFAARDPLPGRIGASCYGVLCGSDSTGFEYMCAVEVASLAALKEGIGRMRVPAQRYAVFGYDARSTLRSTWQHVFDWLSTSDYESAHTPDFELYAPHVDPLDARAGIELWVGVVAKPSSGRAIT